MEMTNLIAPEIVNDDFAFTLTSVVADHPVASILELGASSGEGSTACLVRGMASNSTAKLYSLEASKERFALLQKRYADNPRVTCINAFSVPPSEWLTPDDIDRFIPEYGCGFGGHQVKGWLQEEISYHSQSGVPDDGIAQALALNDGPFDFVLIDSSLFTGQAELRAVIGSKFIALDDVRSMKNGENRKTLSLDQSYELFACGRDRYGWCVFRKIA